LILSIGLGAVLARWSIPKVSDPVVLLAVAGTLLLATGFATLIPAQRATAIEPVIALRVD
jgi:ABC-type lipoprotein release transport system permease subunit